MDGNFLPELPTELVDDARRFLGGEGALPQHHLRFGRDGCLLIMDYNIRSFIKCIAYVLLALLRVDGVELLECRPVGTVLPKQVFVVGAVVPGHCRVDPALAGSDAEFVEHHPYFLSREGLQPVELLQQQAALMEEVLLVIGGIVHADGHLADQVGVGDVAEVDDPRDHLPVGEEVDFIHVVLDHLRPEFVVVGRHMFLIPAHQLRNHFLLLLILHILYLILQQVKVSIFHSKSILSLNSASSSKPSNSAMRAPIDLVSSGVRGHRRPVGQGHR